MEYKDTDIEILRPFRSYKSEIRKLRKHENHTSHKIIIIN